MNNKNKYTNTVGNTLKMFGVLTVFAFVLGFSNVTNAATYEYVNTSGGISSVTANNGSNAITLAPNLALHSGVILVDGSSNNVTSVYSSGNTQYMYVNESGVVTVVNANTSSGAFQDSVNISTHSGVMIINSDSDRNMVGDDVRGM